MARQPLSGATLGAVLHPRLLLALLGALLLTTAAYVAVRAMQGDEGSEVTATGEDAALEASTTTSASDDRITSTTPSTSAPERPLVAGAPPPRSGASAAPRAPRTTPKLAPATTLAPPTTATPPPTSAPSYSSSIEAVTAAQLGSSWRPGCPLGPEQLRAVEVSHWGYDGKVHTGRLVVAEAHAERMVAAFRDMFTARFPIQRMVPVDHYGSDDQASMRANNTSGFNCRYVAGTTSWSEHSYGRAIDVNPLVNPYVRGEGVDPPEGAPYADRSRTDAGMIHAGDAAVRAFAAQGWAWGGNWTNGKDYQHFSASGR